MIDKGFYPNSSVYYDLFCFHQGELGVRIPCKPTHPNVTVTLVHKGRLNKEPNYDVIVFQFLKIQYEITTSTLKIECVELSKSEMDISTGTRIFAK